MSLSDSVAPSNGLKGEVKPCVCLILCVPYPSLTLSVYFYWYFLILLMTPRLLVNCHMTCTTHAHHPNISHGRGRENRVKIKGGWCHFPICLYANELFAHFVHQILLMGDEKGVHRAFAIWFAGVSSAYIWCRAANNMVGTFCVFD